MNYRRFKNNKVKATGTVVGDLVYSHRIKDEEFYKFHLSMKRDAGVEDVIPVLVSEDALDVKQNYDGCQATIEGYFQSYNKHIGGRRKLILSIFAQSIYICDEHYFDDKNDILLDGHICKEPVFRITPLTEREICDVLIAANRDCYTSDYIPCILWENNAERASKMNVGDRIRIKGRIQSREYMKKIDEENLEKRVAYEVSCNRIEAVDYEK